MGLARINQVVLVVAHDAGGAREDQCLDAGLLARRHHISRALDVDAAEEVVAHVATALGRGRGRVDDDVGLDASELLEQLVRVGDVGIDILDVVRGGPAVLGALHVQDADVAAAPAAEKQVDDMVAQEAAATDDDDAAETELLLLGLFRCHGRGFNGVD